MFSLLLTIILTSSDANAAAAAAAPPKLERADATEDCRKIIGPTEAACKDADKPTLTDAGRACMEIGGDITGAENAYGKEISRCSQAGARTNLAGRKRVRGSGQAPVTGDTGGLMAENGALFQSCVKGMTTIEGFFKTASRQAAEKLVSVQGSAACKPKAEEFYRALKKKADDGAAMAKAKAGEYAAAGRVVDAQSVQNNNTAAGLGAGGDKDKPGGDNKSGQSAGGAGGGMPDPSALMKAMSDAKAKQDAEAAKAEAERKAQAAKEKAMRVQQCQNNEINRTNAIAQCKRDFPVDTRYTIVVNVKKDQEDCITNVGATHGIVVPNCNTIP